METSRSEMNSCVTFCFSFAVLAAVGEIGSASSAEPEARSRRSRVRQTLHRSHAEDRLPQTLGRLADPGNHAFGEPRAAPGCQSFSLRCRGESRVMSCVLDFVETAYFMALS